jgi:lipoyl(octanoyl) transferase
LADYAICAESRVDAPGVYVNGAKICSIGLRIRRRCSYHGLALNVAMDLEPFTRINPCGFQHLHMTQIKDFYSQVKFAEVEEKMVWYLQENLFG